MRDEQERKAERNREGNNLKLYKLLSRCDLDYDGARLWINLSHTHTSRGTHREHNIGHCFGWTSPFSLVVIL